MCKHTNQQCMQYRAGKHELSFTHQQMPATTCLPPTVLRWCCWCCLLQVFEGRVVEGESSRSGGHVITATAGNGSSKQTYNYATERIVGNGSFGVVFQATCLETAETVSSSNCPTRVCKPTALHHDTPRCSR